MLTNNHAINVALYCGFYLLNISAWERIKQKSNVINTTSPDAVHCIRSAPARGSVTTIKAPAKASESVQESVPFERIDSITEIKVEDTHDNKLSLDADTSSQKVQLDTTERVQVEEKQETPSFEIARRNELKFESLEEAGLETIKDESKQSSEKIDSNPTRIITDTTDLSNNLKVSDNVDVVEDIESKFETTMPENEVQISVDEQSSLDILDESQSKGVDNIVRSVDDEIVDTFTS